MTPAAALGVAAMVGWGIAYVPSAWLVERWPPLVAAGARLTLAGLVLLAALALSGRPSTMRSRSPPPRRCRSGSSWCR